MNAAASSTMNARIWAMLIALSLLWGGSFFFISIAVREWPPLTIVVVRVALAASALIAFVLITRPVLRWSGAVLLTLIGMSVLNNVIPFTLIVWAQGHIPSGLASILNATTPLFTVALLHVATDEKAGMLKALGLFTGFIGVVIMLGRDFGTLGAGAILAELAVLGAAISYAFAGLWSRRIAKQSIPPLIAAGGQLAGSTLILLPVMLIVDRPWLLPLPSVATILAILGLALLSTALAYILFFRILARAGATNLSLVTFLIPISAILLGTAVLGEKLTSAQITGMALIGLGLAFIDGRLFRRQEKAS